MNEPFWVSTQISLSSSNLLLSGIALITSTSKGRKRESNNLDFQQHKFWSIRFDTWRSGEESPRRNHITHICTRQPLITPYPNPRTITHLPSNSLFHHLLNWHNTLSSIRRIISKWSLNKFTVWKIFSFQNLIHQRVLHHLKPPTLFS